MSDLQTRPVALDVQSENIPAEIKALTTWVCWRYEWDEQRQQWAKVPYTPCTVKKSRQHAPIELAIVRFRIRLLLGAA